MKLLATAALVLCASLSAVAQTAVPANALDPFKDTSMVKPPAGAKVAIYEFEDLECPACAQAAPVVHAAIDHYKIPLVRHDFPLTNLHPWSLQAAITARYLQDKASPVIAETFRRDVFASQNSIASRDDLDNFTRHWFQTHGVAQPFVMDADGACQKEIQADRALGARMGIVHTPCIFVVTPRRWVQVVDVSQLYRTIDVALAETAAPAIGPAKATHR
ncbi:DsbA family protein [Granulicella sibirica]|uniref:Thioredoxin-like fold domain-containing protein n=1 Tax=Granulicella sibirica TaxID=2479048 RepID=A0A4Q0T9Z2_9BACT|nr:thioredoxin domain-containing protein [Granulicella sibirica]RXH58586.1 hypothetical protein GRAN_1896 [Granulicella sibirica]